MKSLTKRQIESLLAHQGRIKKQQEKYRDRVRKLCGEKYGHSQACPIGGLFIMGGSEATGAMPCACGAG